MEQGRNFCGKDRPEPECGKSLFTGLKEPLKPQMEDQGHLLLAGEILAAVYEASLKPFRYSPGDQRYRLLRESADMPGNYDLIPGDVLARQI